VARHASRRGSLRVEYADSRAEAACASVDMMALPLSAPGQVYPAAPFSVAPRTPTRACSVEHICCPWPSRDCVVDAACVIFEDAVAGSDGAVSPPATS
jgi:hypothetical protein